MPTFEFWLSDWEVIVWESETSPRVGETVSLGDYGTFVVTALRRRKRLQNTGAVAAFTCVQVERTSDEG
jgi:hypothetical protein